jgi:hypothetical protein
MSATSYRRRPDYYLAEFVTKRSPKQGNILFMGEDNGRNVEFVVNTFMKVWNNPEYKVYVYDDFADRFGKDRRRTFDAITDDNRKWIVNYTTKDYESLLEHEYTLVVFIDYYTAPEVFTYAIDLWSNLARGGYYFFLNYKDGETMYIGNLNDHPQQGIDRFFREARSSSSDMSMIPYPYLKKF